MTYTNSLRLVIQSSKLLEEQIETLRSVEVCRTVVIKTRSLVTIFTGIMPSFLSLYHPLCGIIRTSLHLNVN